MSFLHPYCIYTSYTYTYSIYIYVIHICIHAVYTDCLQVSTSDLGPGGADHGVTRPVIHLLGPLRPSSTPFCMAHTADAWNMLKSAAWKRACLLNNFVGIPCLLHIAPWMCCCLGLFPRFKNGRTSTRQRQLQDHHVDVRPRVRMLKFEVSLLPFWLQLPLQQEG